MSNVFEIIHRLFQKHPLFLIGGFCLTGFCYGAEFVPGTTAYHPSQGFPQYQTVSSNTVMFGEQQPLQGSGVMFFDQNNQLVRKVDAFTFDTIHPELNLFFI